MFAAAPEPNPAGRGWGAVLVLVLAYALSFVDRQVISLLVEPIRADLHVTDTQIGLLQGPAFGLFYSLMGLPLGWLADRTHRVRLIAAGIALWSVMTLASGLATSFAGLFAARMGVGVGEAALVPAAVSLLADLFRAERRALPMSVFTAGLSVGSGLALVLGGAFIAYAASHAADLPFLGGWLAGHRPWQVVLILAACLGIPVCLAVLSMPEPPRRDVPSAAGLDAVSPARLRDLRGDVGLFGPMLGAMALLYLHSNANSAWLPTLFIREFGWTASKVGLSLGFWIVAAAVPGNILSGLIAAGLARRGRADAPLLAMMVGCGLMTVVAVAGPLAPSPGLAMAGAAGVYLAIALCFGVATASFVAITPARLRGRVVALYLLLGNLVGMGLGPVTVGWALDHLLADPRRVGAAIALVAMVVVGPAFLLLLVARPRFAARAALLAQHT